MRRALRFAVTAVILAGSVSDAGAVTVGQRITQWVKKKAAVVVAFYVPSAVTFAPEVSLSTSGAGPAATAAGLGTTDSGFGIHSMCLKGTLGSTTNSGNLANWTLHNIDVTTNWGTTGANTSESVPGDNLAIDNAAGSRGSWRYNLGDSTNASGSTAVSGHAVELASLNIIRPASFDCYLWAHSINLATGLKKMVVYRNGALITSGATETGTVPAILAAITNGKGWGINAVAGNGSAGYYGGGYDIADVFFDWHIQTDNTGTNWKTYLEANGALPASTIAAFYDVASSRPRDPYAAGVWASTPLGAQPDLLFSGNKSTFATNKGSITTSFVLQGQDAGNHVLYDAAVGPSGPVDALPYLNWNAVANIVTAGSPSSFTIDNRWNPIALGDMLVVVVQSSDNSTVTRDFGGTSLTAGWTRLGAIAVPDGSSYPQNSAAFYKIAAAGDVTAARATWSSPPTISIGVPATALRSLTWHLLDYGQATSITFAGAANVSSVNITAPSISYSASSLLVNAYCPFEPSYSGIRKSPAGQNLRWKSFGSSGSIASCIITDEKLTGSGTTGTRTATQGTAHVTSGMSMVIVP